MTDQPATSKSRDLALLLLDPDELAAECRRAGIIAVAAMVCSLASITIFILRATGAVS